MKVVGYIRVSTEEQASKGMSLATQRTKLRGYAKLHDLELVEIAEDGGQSAKSLERPGLQRALAMLRRGEVQGLVIAKLDRLSRSVRDWNALIDGWFGERAGKQLFSVADSIDTTTAAGRLVLNVLMSVAQWEREAIGERTRDVLRHKIANGERVGKVKFGFDLAPDGKRLVPNPTEQRAIKLMVRLRKRGKSLPAICAALTARGFATKENKKWQPATVLYVLRRTMTKTA